MEAAAVPTTPHLAVRPCACGYLYGSEPHECATGDPCPTCRRVGICATWCPEGGSYPMDSEA